VSIRELREKGPQREARLKGSPIRKYKAQKGRRKEEMKAHWCRAKAVGSGVVVTKGKKPKTVRGKGPDKEGKRARSIGEMKSCKEKFFPAGPKPRKNLA